MKKAFTMVELIFVIVIIGILSAVAVPKLMATRDDAIIAKNIEYISASMTEISTYIIAKGDVKSDLTEMSPILEVLKAQNRVTIDTATKSSAVKIGEESDCITIDIDSSGTTELLKTKFSENTTDRICNLVQQAIKEKNYPLILRGRLIKY
jgi:prepilin-type N-terminal cleavage/methylation domain-containing protein